MVVKSEACSSNVGQVGRDVSTGDVDPFVLNVFGMNELDVLDDLKFVEQHGADQTVEIAAGDQTKPSLTLFRQRCGSGA